MDPLKPLMEVLQPPWRYFVLGLAVLLLTAPRAVELHASWLDFRLGRRELDREKRHLELLKLKYEIAALRKQHDLPEAGALDSGTLVVPAAAAPAPGSLVPSQTPATP